jgi:hypothetical protein
MAPVPEDDAADRHAEGAVSDPAGEDPDEAVDQDLTEGDLAGPTSSPMSSPSGSLPLPLSPVSADRVRWVAVATTLVSAGALLVAFASGYAATLAVTLVLALAVSWGWPVLAGSFTPTATSVVLAVASVAIVLSALRDDLRWVAAAVAFGIVLSFLGQLIRRTGREGLVLTLLASFGGLAVIASGTTAVVAANTAYGRAVAVIAMAAVAAGLVADLLAGLRTASPVLGVVALLAASVGALVAGASLDEVGTLAALGIGAAAGTVSWSLRRVFALSPAMVTARGQIGAGTGSVLAVGAIVHLFAVFS